MPLAKYTAEQVAKHRSPKDLWLAIHGKVYDVSKFLFEHPGGAEILQEHAGIDASEAFEDIGHSADARQLLQAFLIGELVDAGDAGNPESASEAGDKTPLTANSKRTMIICMSALGMALMACCLAWYLQSHRHN